MNLPTLSNSNSINNDNNNNNNNNNNSNNNNNHLFLLDIFTHKLTNKDNSLLKWACTP